MRVNFVLYLVVLVLLAGCGHRGAPTGGPKDTVAPVITSIEPSPFGEMGDLTVTFSKPIDRNSLMTGFYTYPPMIRKKFDWKDQTTLRIRFLEDFEPDTNYFVTFSTDVQCTHNNPLESDVTYVFKHGRLQNGRIAGDLQVDPALPPDLPVDVTLYNADSTRVYDTRLEPGSFVFDNLNPGRYFVQAWVDKNDNGRYDYGSDGWGRTDSLDVNRDPVRLRVVVQDTIPPLMQRAQSQFDNLVEVTFKEPVTRIGSADLMSADSLRQSIPVISWTIRSDKVSFLTGEQSVAKQRLRVFGATDARGNIRRADSLFFQTIARRDSIPPILETSSPRNGATVGSLRPEFRLLFSEVIPEGRLELSLQSVETGSTVPVMVESSGSTVCVARPEEDLRNYSTYRLFVGRNTTDTNGNRLKEPVEIKFITVIPESGK
jgi:hypothetical protein